MFYTERSRMILELISLTPRDLESSMNLVSLTPRDPE